MTRFEVTNASCEGLHFSEPAVHLLEPLADQLERFTQTLLQSCVKLLVHRSAHLFKL